VPMNPATAVCFLLCGASLWLGRRPDARGWRAWSARVLALVVATVGAVALSELCVGWQSGIDTHLFPSRLAGNRIAPNTAVCLFLIGSGLALLDARGRRGRGPAALLLLAGGALAMLAVAGYAYAV